MSNYVTSKNCTSLFLAKEVTLSANNTTEAINLFKLTGGVRVLKLYGICIAKTTLANMTDCHFNLYDSTASVAITKATTLTMSTAIVGSLVGRIAAATANAAFLPGTVGGIAESALNPLIDFAFVAIQKTGANTYIQWKYTTTDAPINARFRFYTEYEPLDGGYLTII